MGLNVVQFGLESDDVVGLTPDQRTAEELFFGISIVSKGEPVYWNLKYPRYRYFFGYAEVMYGAFVVESIELVFLNQQLLYFRDIAYGINSTTGCYFKAYGAKDTPPIPLQPHTVKTRQPFTSIRFRLRDGVTANANISWIVAEPKCDDVPDEPSPDQAHPPSPNNANSNPGARPPQQGGDNEDRSANDGHYNPDDGLPPPPGTPVGDPQFRLVYNGYTHEDVPYQGVKDLEIKDPAQNVYVTREQIQGSNSVGGKPDYRLRVYNSGVEIFGNATGYDLQGEIAYY